MNDFIINDDNYFEHSTPSYDFAKGLIPRDYGQHPVGSYASSVAFGDDMEIIPRDEWPQRCADQLAEKSRMSDIANIGNFGNRIPSLDQNGQGFCWAYSTTCAVQLLRAMAAMPFVQLSPHAVACKIYNHQDRGAWGALSLDFIVANGVPADSFWPQKSMSREHDTEATWHNASLYKITEGWVDMDVSHPADAEMNFDQVATCLLSLIPVVCDFNWWGHSVCGMDLVDMKPELKQQGLHDPNRWGNRIRNSWTDNWGNNGNGVLQGSKAIPDGACAPRVVTGG